MIKTKKIRNTIKVCEYFNIDSHMTVNLVRRPIEQVYAIACYLQSMNISLVDNMKLHAFFSYANSVLKKKYKIDVKKLVQLYPMPDNILKESLDEYIK